MKKIGKNIPSFCCFHLFLFFFLLFTSFSPLSWAKEDHLEVLATVDKNKMSLEEAFTLTVSISSSNNIQLQEPVLPRLPNFEFLNAWQSSETNSQFIQGSFQQKRTRKFNYRFQPKKEGLFVIESIKVQVNGVERQTQPIRIQVLSASSTGSLGIPSPSPAPVPSPSPPPNLRNFFDSKGEDLEDLLSHFFGKSGSQPDSKDQLFVHVKVDKKEVFEGEQILASWIIYTRANVRDVDQLKHPILKGFWKENVKVANQLQVEKEIINGIVYNKIFLTTYALFPIYPGEIIIDPYKVRVLLVTPSVFGFGRSYHATKSSLPVKVRVLPLPKEGQPQNFNKGVGEFQASVQLDREKVSVNQPINLKIRFYGQGNAKSIELPSTLHFPSSLEHYDTRKEFQFSKDGTSYKEFELVLVPRQEGEIHFPSLETSSFNPITKTYYPLPAPTLKIQVSPDQTAPAIPSSSLRDIVKQKKETENLEKKKKTRLPPPLLNWKDPLTSPFFSLSRQLNKKPWIWAVLFSSVFLIFLWMYLHWLKGRDRKNFKKVFSRRFNQIKARVSKEDWRAVGVEGTNLVYLVLAEISGEEGANLQVNELLKKTPPSIRNEIELPLKKIMKTLETLSFAPQELASSLNNPSKLKEVVSEMERVLNVALKGRLKKENLDFSSKNEKNKIHLFFFLSLFFLFSFLSFSFHLKAHIFPLEISTDDDMPAPRWMYEEKAKKEMEKISQERTKTLYLIKKSQREKKYNTCLKLVKDIKNADILKAWLSLTRLQCAKNQVLQEKGQKTSSSLEELRESLILVRQVRTSREKWPSSLKADYINAILLFLREKRKDSGTLFISNFVRDLENLKTQMTPQQKALFFLEMAFIMKKEKNEIATRDFLIRSLNENSSQEAQKELRKILSSIKSKKELSLKDKNIFEKFFPSEQERKPARVKEKKDTRANLSRFKKERSLFDQMKKASYRKQRWLAVQKALDLIRFYPGGRKAKEASSEVLNIYFQIAYSLHQTSKNQRRVYQRRKLLKDKILKQMKKAGSDKLTYWSHRIYRKHFYQDALFLAEQALKKSSLGSDASQSLKILAYSSLYRGNFQQAEIYLKKLSFEHSGTEIGDEALFRLGLLKFRLGRYLPASDYLKHLIDSSHRFKMESYYWLWRAQQILNDKKASTWAKALIEQYPLTYYGLKARAELNQGYFKWPSEDNPHFIKPIKNQFWLMPEERKSWTRFKILLSAGWFEEAKEELEIFSNFATTPEQKVIWARLWNLAFAHDKATSLLQEAFTENHLLFRPSIFKWAYPNEFQKIIERESHKHGVDPLLVKSVIKQESAYNVLARSSANALGLMQLLPQTAREQAQLMRKKLPSQNDLFNPNLNVSLGVPYLKRMIRAFKGHVPLALAAYNAGIGNVRMWKRGRKDLLNIENHLYSHFNNEIWIDELPWSETRFYVKAVLRNFLIYLIIQRRETKWNPQFWLPKNVEKMGFEQEEEEKKPSTKILVKRSI